MKTVNLYRKRFFNLLESEMGNVKPLIKEDLTQDDSELYEDIYDEEEISEVDDLDAEIDRILSSDN